MLSKRSGRNAHRVLNPTFAASQAIRIAIPFFATWSMMSALRMVERLAIANTGWVTPSVGFAINLLLFKWMIVVQWATPLRLPSAYFMPRRFEKAFIYEWLGVRLFGRIVKSSRRVNRFSGGRSGLQRFAHGTKHSETVHLLPLMGVTCFAAYISFRARWDVGGWAMVFSIPIHVYPVMLQRYHRIRIQPLLERLNTEW